MATLAVEPKWSVSSQYGVLLSRTATRRPPAYLLVVVAALDRGHTIDGGLHPPAVAVIHEADTGLAAHPRQPVLWPGGQDRLGVVTQRAGDASCSQFSAFHTWANVIPARSSSVGCGVIQLLSASINLWPL